ncbi:hypothetical protein Taro_037639 [Colocasia esculenta]|uniref:Uncharacterized protein n=1 Tax=Colocasia esculenta TaxID=4460 RepID=A0A843WBM4_COLES|nr:hypothetical protein [Colocasia esculenta]
MMNSAKEAWPNLALICRAVFFCGVCARSANNPTAAFFFPWMLSLCNNADLGISLVQLEYPIVSLAPQWEECVGDDLKDLQMVAVNVEVEVEG